MLPGEILISHLLIQKYTANKYAINVYTCMRYCVLPIGVSDDLECTAK